MDLNKTDFGERAFGKASKVAVTVKYESQQHALDFIWSTLGSGNAIGVIEGPEGSGKSTVMRQFVGELPPAHIEAETTMAGGESLWRANWSTQADPFADVARGTSRGPGWQRAATGYVREPARIVEARASAVSLGNKGRDDLAVGMRVFHQKFGYGAIAEIEGNKLEIDFETAGRKRVIDSFVSIG